MTTRARSSSTAELVERDRERIADAAKIRFFPFAPVGGSGSRLVDADGRSWLDFTAGWAVTNTGYGDPAIRDAVEAEMARGSYAGLVSAAIDQSIRRSGSQTVIVSIKASFCSNNPRRTPPTPP